MDWQLQLNDGSWVEAQELPKDPSGYCQAILMNGKEKHLILTVHKTPISTHWIVTY